MELPGSIMSDLAKSIDELEKEMGILQHHDAVAGTEKQAVANDYVYRLHKSEKSVLNVNKKND